MSALPTTAKSPETIAWHGDVDGHLRLIDQTRLPLELVYLDCKSVETVWEAIKMLRVRGAPAIGIAAAYGVCIGMQSVPTDSESFFAQLNHVVDYLATSRPTAVNLFWALDRIRSRRSNCRACQRMRFGSNYLPKPEPFMTRTEPPVMPSANSVRR